MNRIRLPLFLLAMASTCGWADQHASPLPAVTPSPTATPSLTATPLPSPLSIPVATSTPSPEPGSEAPSALTLADDHFSRRSIGAIDNVARPQEVDAAIELYRRAVSSDPKNIEVLAKLMRALQFRGAYTGLGVEEKKAFFDEGKTLGQEAVDRLEAEVIMKRGLSRIEALRLVKGTPALYLWTAIHWGEWGLARGKFASARGGVAGRLRDLAQTVIDLDPLFEDAAGYRMLGRIHAEAPKIPFITGWVSHDKGVQYLRRADKLSPDHPITCFFLAEAILDHEPENGEEARKLLERCASLTPRPGRILEDSVYIADARAKLDQLRP